MQVISKHGIIDIEIYKDESFANKQFFEAIAYNNQSEKMGSVSFEVKEKMVWIWLIETNTKYMHQGIGQSLLSMVEYMAVKNNCNLISGKFFPKNRYAEPFYLKNHYQIDDDYDKFVEKYISQYEKELILKNTHRILLSEFEIKDISQKPPIICDSQSNAKIL